MLKKGLIGKGRKAFGDITGANLIGIGLFFLVAVFLIVPIGNRFGKAEAASIKRGLDDFMVKAEGLKAGDSVTHSFTVDNGLWLVSFNTGESSNGKAKRSADCGSSTCICSCVDDKCEKISDTKKGRRDCRQLFGHISLIAQGGISGNNGGEQVNPDNKYIDDGKGYYFYVKGEKTFSLILRKSGVEPNAKLYVGNN